VIPRDSGTLSRAIQVSVQGSELPSGPGNGHLTKSAAYTSVLNRSPGGQDIDGGILVKRIRTGLTVTISISITIAIGVEVVPRLPKDVFLQYSYESSLTSTPSSTSTLQLRLRP
jgi:hypothetical protein